MKKTLHEEDTYMKSEHKKIKKKFFLTIICEKKMSIL